MMVGGVGHVPQEEKPEEMVHLIREFMTNRPTPSGEVNKQEQRRLLRELSVLFRVRRK